MSGSPKRDCPFSCMVDVFTPEQIQQLLGVLPDLGTIGMRAYILLANALAAKQDRDRPISTSSSGSSSTPTNSPARRMRHPTADSEN